MSLYDGNLIGTLSTFSIVQHHGKSRWHEGCCLETENAFA